MMVMVCDGMLEGQERRVFTSEKLETMSGRGKRKRINNGSTKKTSSTIGNANAEQVVDDSESASRSNTPDNSPSTATLTSLIPPVQPISDEFDLPKCLWRDEAFQLKLVELGQFLIEKLKSICVANQIAVKPDELMGVTKGDPRMTQKLFGDFKSAQRLKTEAKAIAYIQETSNDTWRVGVALTDAARGSGKTRLLDDLARVPLSSPQFELFLRIPISFKSERDSPLVHPLAARVLLQFVSGDHRSIAALHQIDQLLASCTTKDVDDVAHYVLDGVEAVFFGRHGCARGRGRTVLLIDDLESVRNAAFKDFKAIHELLRFGSHSRCAVLTVTGWTVQTEPMKDRDSVVPPVWLPLEKFDVWDEKVQAVVQAQVDANWPDVRFTIQPKMWAVLAATGGRPLEILEVLDALHRQNDNNLDDDRLIDILCSVPTPCDAFAKYLLPSLLNVRFHPCDEIEVLAQLGNVAALLNANGVIDTFNCVPMVSLRHLNALPTNGVECANLRSVVRALVSTMVLPDSDTVVERAWVLLMMCVLQLQFMVRCTDARNDFWAEPGHTGLVRGWPSCPTASAIDVFALGFSRASRTEALFARPWLAFSGCGTIHRKIELAGSPPTLALWRDLWAATVEPGSAVPVGWPAQMQLAVEWRSPCIVCIAQPSLVDFMLLVGRAGGTGAEAPHVYMFHTQSWSSDMAQADVKRAVGKLAKKLNVLFAPELAETHVLRQAGVHKPQQVTLCVVAKSFDSIEFKKPLFNIVLFNRDDFAGMCGGAFHETSFYRNLLNA